MNKTVKTAFFCQNCGNQSPKWLGKCPSCGQWNTYVEEITTKPEAKPWASADSKKTKQIKAKKLSEVDSQEDIRILTPDAELNRVLGGGIVPGCMVLIGGEPGIGKSTLMLQIALSMSYLKVLYVSGEESENQIKMRAERLGALENDCYLFTETDIDLIFKQAEQLQPEMLVIDSIQTLQTSQIESAAGSVSQVRECTAQLMRYAKESGVPVFLIGHITKDGSLAGPKVLEHMVDTVLQFEGDRHLSYRLLRSTKNRFGSTNELGIYEMESAGLRQVSNPSELLISRYDEALSGVAIACTMEGNRPILVEIQALVSPASFGTPQRNSTGYDTKRLQMLLAVLEKRCGYRLGQQDVFLNVAGGLKLEDPAADLAVCAALVSSFEECPLPSKMVFAAEVGLGGELRAVMRTEQRLIEAEKLGYTHFATSQFASKTMTSSSLSISLSMVSKLSELFESIIQ